ncbi:Cys-Gln thioester bond-forming surface protein [Embleya sp. NBC_00896]|uniref:Cys-Gln thioester bond-forming surface protein n=1 Tax=Embleya sp. NBC_00896 TaxID=2975961 RepID=UPI003870AFEA|nr:thioester domain-containing protein [Embleya sp. NBC_00896]
MFRAPGRMATRLSALTVATGLAAAGVIGFSGIAQADGVSGALKGFGKDQGLSVALKGSGPISGVHQAGFFNLQLEGGETIKVYCIDLLHKTTDNYKESPWGGTWLSDKDVPADKKAKLKWILANSFPTKSVDQLKATTGIAGLEANEAGAATQAAIWHMSDGADIDTAKETNEDVKKLYDYLVKNAKSDDGNEPKISLKLDPEEVSGSPSDKPGVGPFTVSTSANGKAITAALSGAAGAKLVDKDGAVSNGKVGDGDKLWVKPAEGSDKGEAKLKVSGSANIDAGRVFKGVKPGQLLIAVGQENVKVSDESTAKWNAKGAAPAFNAKEQCTAGGVEVVVTNKGDQPFNGTIGDTKISVKPGVPVTQLVKVAEDTAYKIVVKDEAGKVLKTFEGTLDCKTETTTGGSTGGTTQQPTAPAPVNPKGPNLAETGSDGSNTPAILGGAGALVLVGGGLVFYTLRRRNGSNGATA